MIYHYDYNYKDLLKAPRVAIGPQRLLIATLGVALTHVVFILSSYLAFAMSGYQVLDIWQTYGLFPINTGIRLGTFPGLIWLTGIALSLFVFLVTSTSVARAVYMHMRDNYFYTSKQCLQFSIKRSKSILVLYLTYLFLIVPFIIGAAVMAIIGRISWIGEILNALATLPYIFSGMVLVFITISMLVSFFLGPAIIATAEEDGFGAAVRVMHLTWSQPWRMASYLLLSAILLIAGMLVFVFVLKIGLIIYSILFMPLMHSLAPILNNALHLVEVSIGGLDQTLRGLAGAKGIKMIYLKQHYPDLDLSTSREIASSIVYFFLMVAGYMAIGYGQAIISASQVISYIIYELKLTTKNLLERADSEIDEGSEAFEFNILENTKKL